MHSEVLKYPVVQQYRSTLWYTSTQVHKYTSKRVHEDTSTQGHGHTRTRVHDCRTSEPLSSSLCALALCSVSAITVRSLWRIRSIQTSNSRTLYDLRRVLHAHLDSPESRVQTGSRTDSQRAREPARQTARHITRQADRYIYGRQADRHTRGAHFSH